MIAPPIRPRYRQESGIAAASRLAHRGTPYGASLSFATTTHLWPLSDPPSRKPANATGHRQAARSIPGRALASSMLDSPCQGSRTGLTPPISTSVPSTLSSGRLRQPPLRAHRVTRASAKPRLTRSTTGSLAELPYHPHIQHVHPADTFWYFQGAPELLALACERLERTWEEPSTDEASITRARMPLSWERSRRTRPRQIRRGKGLR